MTAPSGPDGYRRCKTLPPTQGPRKSRQSCPRPDACPLRSAAGQPVRCRSAESRGRCPKDWSWSLGQGPRWLVPCWDSRGLSRRSTRSGVPCPWSSNPCAGAKARASNRRRVAPQCGHHLLHFFELHLQCFLGAGRVQLHVLRWVSLFRHGFRALKHHVIITCVHLRSNHGEGSQSTCLTRNRAGSHWSKAKRSGNFHKFGTQVTAWAKMA